MKYRKKSKKTQQNDDNEESYETQDTSTDSILTKTIPKSKIIKKIPKKTGHLNQKKSKLKANLEIEQKEQNQKLEADERLDVIKPVEDLSRTRRRSTLIISRSLFGDESTKSSRRSSVNSETKIILEQSIKTSPVKHVLVPSWRQSVFKPTYKLEGTENLNDDFYLKRHQKPENEEKLIKKRDLRRQREEFMKLKLLNRTRTNQQTIKKEIKSPVKTSVDDDLKKEIKEKNADEINLEDIEYIQIIDDNDDCPENTEKETEPVAKTDKKEITESPKSKKSENKSVKNQKLTQNSENSKQNKKLNRCKSYPSLPLNPVNDNLNNISINTRVIDKTNNKKHVKKSLDVYDDLDSDYLDVTNSENIIKSVSTRPNKRKSAPNSSSIITKLPAKKRTRLSSQIE